MKDFIEAHAEDDKRRSVRRMSSMSERQKRGQSLRYRRQSMAAEANKNGYDNTIAELDEPQENATDKVPISKVRDPDEPVELTSIKPIDDEGKVSLTKVGEPNENEGYTEEYQVRY